MNFGDIEDLSERLNVLSVLGGQIRHVYYPGNDRVRVKLTFHLSLIPMIEVPVHNRMMGLPRFPPLSHVFLLRQRL